MRGAEPVIARHEDGMRATVNGILNFRTVVTLFTILASLACVTLASAADERTGTAVTVSEPSKWRLGVAFGYGMRDNPLVQSDDIPIIVDIDLAWFGERFFFDNGDIGLTLVDNPRLTTAIVARVNSDRVFFGKTNTKFVSLSVDGEPSPIAVVVTVPDRDYAIEIGVELLTDGDWGRLQLAAYHDVSGTHDGYEFDFDYSFGWRNQRWYLEPSFGLTYKSSALNDYFWGVRPIESNEALPVYTVKSGINTHVRLLFSYQIDQNWVFSLAGEFERLNDNAAASPLVSDANVLGYFIGLGYRF